MAGNDGKDPMEDARAVQTGGIFGGTPVPLPRAESIVAGPSAPNLPLPRIPQPLSEHYHRARRNLTLASAVLLAWSTVGLAVSEVSAEGAKLTIARPELIPWVLRAAVGYFFIRTWLEFLECDPDRTIRWSPRVDIWISTAIGVSALASPWFWQYWRYTAGLFGVGAVGGLGYAAFRRRQELLAVLREVRWRQSVTFAVVVSVATIVASIETAIGGDVAELAWTVVQIAVITTISASAGFLYRRIKQESRAEAELIARERELKPPGWWTSDLEGLLRRLRKEQGNRDVGGLDMTGHPRAVELIQRTLAWAEKHPDEAGVTSTETGGPSKAESSEDV